MTGAVLCSLSSHFHTYVAASNIRKEPLQYITMQPAHTETEQGPRKEHGKNESSPATTCLETRLKQSTTELVLLQHVVLFIKINPQPFDFGGAFLAKQCLKKKYVRKDTKFLNK